MGPATGEQARFGGDWLPDWLPLSIAKPPDLAPLEEELDERRRRLEPNACSRGDIGIAYTRAGEALRLRDDPTLDPAALDPPSALPFAACQPGCALILSEGKCRARRALSGERAKGSKLVEEVGDEP